MIFQHLKTTLELTDHIRETYHLNLAEALKILEVTYLREIEKRLEEITPRE